MSEQMGPVQRDVLRTLKCALYAKHPALTVDQISRVLADAYGLRTGPRWFCGQIQGALSGMRRYGNRYWVEEEFSDPTVRKWRITASGCNALWPE